jgi:hypothetical protein
MHGDCQTFDCQTLALVEFSVGIHRFLGFDSGLSRENVVATAARYDFVWGVSYKNVPLFKAHNPSLITLMY